MTLQRNTGQPVTIPDPPEGVRDASNAITSLLIDANTEKVGFTGVVWWPGSGDSKNIQNVEMLTGAVTSPIGTVQFSLQNMSVAGGGGLPDGTADQTASTSSFPAANSAFKSGNLSAVRAVARGETICVVIEATAWTSGSFNIAGMTTQTQLDTTHLRLYSGGSWAGPVQAIPLLKLYFDDGSIGTLLGCWYGVAASEAFASNSSPAKRGNRFTLPYPIEVSGVRLQMGINAYANDYNIVLYRGTSVLETLACDANQDYQGGIFPHFHQFSTRYTFDANETFYVMLEPSTTGSLNMPVITVPLAADLALLPGGTSVQYTTFSGGTPTVTATKRALVSVLASAFDDAAGGGGSGVTSPLIGLGPLIRI